MTDRSRCDAGSRMEPENEELQAELSDEHWLLIADLFENPKPSPKAAARWSTRELVSKVCCGCSAAAPAGKICRRVFHLDRRSVAGLSNGLAKAHLIGRGSV
ncbi:MAG: hypothetical protein RIC12_01780 [Pirellulales bacterium]